MLNTVADRIIMTSDTKYRVIADGNSMSMEWIVPDAEASDTKYRVIADGNKVPPLHDQLIP